MKRTVFPGTKEDPAGRDRLGRAISNLSRAHGSDERVGVENYGEFINFYESLIRNAQADDFPPTGP